MLAVVLAIFAYGQPTFSHGKLGIVPGGTEVWQTQSQLPITQQNDPYGNAVQGLTLDNPKPKSHNPPLQLGGVGYMESLAPIYAAIANGDLVQRQVRRISRTASVVATSVPDPTSGGTLPLVQLTVTASSRALGQRLARLAAADLRARREPAGRRQDLAAQRVRLSRAGGFSGQAPQGPQADRGFARVRRGPGGRDHASVHLGELPHRSDRRGGSSLGCFKDRP